MTVTSSSAKKKISNTYADPFTDPINKATIGHPQNPHHGGPRELDWVPLHLLYFLVLCTRPFLFLSEPTPRCGIRHGEEPSPPCGFGGILLVVLRLFDPLASSKRGWNGMEWREGEPLVVLDPQ